MQWWQKAWITVMYSQDMLDDNTIWLSLFYLLPIQHIHFHYFSERPCKYIYKYIYIYIYIYIIPENKCHSVFIGILTRLEIFKNLLIYTYLLIFICHSLSLSIYLSLSLYIYIYIYIYTYTEDLQVYGKCNLCAKFKY